MAVGDAYVFPGFLTPVLTRISFQSHRLLFSHASAEVRGENTPERKSRLNQVSNSQPPGHESDTLTTEPQIMTWICTTQNLLRITFSFSDLMLKTNRLKKDFFL